MAQTNSNVNWLVQSAQLDKDDARFQRYLPNKETLYQILVVALVVR